jgi:hypothetical protein
MRGDPVEAMEVAKQIIGKKVAVDPGSLEAILPVRKSRKWSRIAAIYSLGFLAEDSAVPALLQILLDQKSQLGSGRMPPKRSVILAKPGRFPRLAKFCGANPRRACRNPASMRSRRSAAPKLVPSFKPPGRAGANPSPCRINATRNRGTDRTLCATTPAQALDSPARNCTLTTSSKTPASSATPTFSMRDGLSRCQPSANSSLTVYSFCCQLRGWREREDHPVANWARE